MSWCDLSKNTKYSTQYRVFAFSKHEPRFPRFSMVSSSARGMSSNSCQKGGNLRTEKKRY